MPLKPFVIFICLLLACNIYAQKPAKNPPAIDTSFTDYDELFNELEYFLDSITAPRSFTMFNLGISSGFFNFQQKNEFALEALRKTTYSPSLSYYDKSGLGISGEASILDDGNKINPYQYSLTGSYDYLPNRKFITGVAITTFFTKKNLPFYTSPLKNEVYAYFTYRDFWVKPTVAVSYGWGSRKDYQEREEYITSIQLARRGFTRINTEETINDFSVNIAARHDFYWLDIFSKKDYFKLTPQVVFTSGTQQFGFNQTSNTYATVRRSQANILYNTEKINFDNNLYFQPLSFSAFLKTEYSNGIFFIQPQLMFNYYFPASENKLSNAIVINTGIIF